MRAVTLYQTAVVVAFIALLEALCLGGVIDKVTMPPPHIIARDFVLMVWHGRYFADIAITIGVILLLIDGVGSRQEAPAKPSELAPAGKSASDEEDDEDDDEDEDGDAKSEPEAPKPDSAA